MRTVRVTPSGDFFRIRFLVLNALHFVTIVIKKCSYVLWTTIIVSHYIIQRFSPLLNLISNRPREFRNSSYTFICNFLGDNIDEKSCSYMIFIRVGHGIDWLTEAVDTHTHTQ